MTITTRLRLIILQCSQRGFTEARTFMNLPSIDRKQKKRINEAGKRSSRREIHIDHSPTCRSHQQDAIFRNEELEG